MQVISVYRFCIPQLWVSIMVLSSPKHVYYTHVFSPEGCPGRLVSAPVRTRCGGGATSWVAGA